MRGAFQSVHWFLPISIVFFLQFPVSVLHLMPLALSLALLWGGDTYHDICVFVHLRICVFVYLCICLCICLCIYLCICVSVYLCICVFVYAIGVVSWPSCEAETHIMTFTQSLSQTYRTWLTGEGGGSFPCDLILIMIIVKISKLMKWQWLYEGFQDIFKVLILGIS